MSTFESYSPELKSNKINQYQYQYQQQFTGTVHHEQENVHKNNSMLKNIQSCFEAYKHNSSKGLKLKYST